MDMQKIQDSVFSIVKTTNLSPAVFSFLQPSDDFTDKTPLGGILKDTKHGWLALGPKFCVVDLRTGLKVAARTFGATLSNITTVRCVVELPDPLTENSQQLLISLQCDDIGMICVLHINGSQILRCMQTDVVVTELAICGTIPDGPFTCFDGLVMAGTKRGEIFVFDLNRASLIQALKDISQGYEHLVQNEAHPTNLSFLPLNAIQRIEEQRELALENDHHLAILLNENSMVDGQYIFRNPDGTVRMKAKRDHIRVTVLQYIPQLGSMAVGFNFGAFQIWNLMTFDLEFTSQVNIECLPVTHFAFQEPCDDPRAFCYLWVVFSVIDRFEEEEFPLAVMYSLTYQGKRMLSDTKCLYQDFSTAAIRFQLELSTLDESPLLGGKCISCHSYSIKSTLGDEGEDSMLNICQIVWECWGEDANTQMQYGMLLFDLDQWYKDQMPATHRLESNTFVSVTWCREVAARGTVTLHARLAPATVCPYSHPTRLEEHFYPNSLQYNCIWLNTSECVNLRTVGIQRQVVGALEAAGGSALLHPARLARAAAAAGLAPHAARASRHHTDEEDQRRYLLSVALEARLSRFLKRCAHDWATGSHSGVGCTLPFLVDWAWKRAVELKENAKELTAPLFVSSALPDRNVIRCLEHCVQQLTQLTGLMDAILTKCCNLVVPDALSEMEERHVGIGCVSLYFQVVAWLLRVGLLPERADSLPYPRAPLADTYNKRRLKLNRLQDNSNPEESGANKSCSLLYIDQLIEQEFGGDKIHQMWIKGGSENGLYPPPSLYSLLRLYLLPEIAEEHKHSLVLYLLVDYSMIYDDVRNEAVIRRLMQFPTMFGLSNTAIKATQAFWHLDHRDFDFALDQLQCLSGNTLHEWQHNVVLSSLLAQKKTQAALQYLHVRKPAPIQNIKDGDVATNYSHRLNDHDKLEDWQSCCNLYLARGLVYEALDVIRICVQNAASLNDKAQVLNFFFKGCRNTGNLSKILQVTLLPFEEEVFVKYLENCNEPQTSDLLIMYYLQQARYLEAERYNKKLKHNKPQRNKDLSTSVESLFSVVDRDCTRDALVEVVCDALPDIAATVARAASDWDTEPHVNAPKPMSVFVQAKSPKNRFTYKSSFIQDTIENASETWMNKPKTRRGLKRALDIEETPFICTPKLFRTRSILTDQTQSESTPPKRARLNLTGTPRTPKLSSSFRVSDKLADQMEELLDMPEAQSPVQTYRERPETPHSILKIRRIDREDAPSPVDSRYLGDSDDELLETASSHTHYSDSTNKHLRFTIPTASESGSTPSPPVGDVPDAVERDATMSTTVREKEMDISTDSFATTTSHAINENRPLESPPKKLATELNVQPRRSYKDTVRARRSLSISANSSLSEDPNTSIESIADIPVTLLNPRYSGERKRSTIAIQDEGSSQRTERDTNQSNLTEREMDKPQQTNFSARDIEINSQQQRNLEQSNSIGDTKRNLEESRDMLRNLQQSDFSVQDIELRYRFGQHPPMQDDTVTVFGGEKKEMERLEVPRTPRGRRGIRSIGESSTPLVNRSRSCTPERQDSPITTPLHPSRLTRSRSRSKTPEVSPRSSPLAPIIEQPKQESESEPHQEKTTLSVPRQMRRRSKTPERMEKGVSESPKLEVINESPTKSSDSSTSSPTRRSLRSRSRTPEIEIIPEPVKLSPHSLRSRSKTPEKLMSPKKDPSRAKKSLSRIVLEANTFAKTKQTLESLETEITESRSENVESTPMKVFKQLPSLMDVTLSPIFNKSVLQSSADSNLSENAAKQAKSDDNSSELGLKPLPAFTTLHETYFEKSVLRSYQSSVGDNSQSLQEEKDIQADNKTADTSTDLKPLPAFTTINITDFNRSVLHSYESSTAETSQSIQEAIEKETQQVENVPKPFAAFASMIETDFERSVLHSHQSSVEASEVSKETQNPNTSSLITNDSETEVKEGTESQDTAVRKEKERIVEIEREINEIEGEMSNDSEHGDSDRTVESVEEESVSDEESDESDTSDDVSSIPASDEDDGNEVISIEDSDLNDSETSDTNTDSDINNVIEIEIVNDEKAEQVSEKLELSEKVEGSSIDPLNQAQISLMTDDNSAIESDVSINLNYSDEKTEATEEEQIAEQENRLPVPAEYQVQFVVEETSKTEEPAVTPESMDVVDRSASESELKEVIPKEIIKISKIKTVEEPREQENEKMELTIEKSDTKKLGHISDETEDKSNKDIETANQAKKPDQIKNTEKPSQEVETTQPTQIKNIEKRSKEAETAQSSQIKNIEKPSKEAETAQSSQIKNIEKPSKEAETAQSSQIKNIEKPRKEVETAQSSQIKNIEKPSKEVETTQPSQIKNIEKSSKEVETAQPSQIESIEKPSKEVQTAQSSQLTDEIKEATKSVKPASRTRKRVKSTPSNKSHTETGTQKETSEDTNKETSSKSKESALSKVTEERTESDESEKRALRTRKRVKSTYSNKSYKETESETVKEISKETKQESDLPKKLGDTMETDEVRTPVTRKRSDSNASIKSKGAGDAPKETATKEDIKEVKKTQESEEPKTPATRKRSQSNASKTEEKTPEDTPTTKRRPKTPTSAEVRKIITRRVSREMAGKLDKSSESLDDSISLTPKRRSARSRSKNVDDNESVISESSVVSNKSKASEDADLKPARKGRKSVVATKPDLSVIPEVMAEESKEGSDMIAEYSGARRLTRTQKAKLESNASRGTAGRTLRRSSTASLASHSSLASDHDDEHIPPPFDVQPIDRISLLNKTDFEGPPDTEELHIEMSPESVASDASKLRRSRLSRAASETKATTSAGTPRAAKISRRVASIDIAESSEAGSPGPSGTDSPARGRRASFNRACEALHTPKGRRTSTDVRSPVDSPAASETDVPVTPSRRPRRASALSNTSQTKSDTGKRSKKMPVLEEDKE